MVDSRPTLGAVRAKSARDEAYVRAHPYEYQGVAEAEEARIAANADPATIAAFATLPPLERPDAWAERDRYLAEVDREAEQARQAALEPQPLNRVLLGQLMQNGISEPKMWHAWLYAGGLHTLQSEPGVGKSWIALWLTTQLIEAGYTVIYIDEEGGEELAVERLLALGADPTRIDTHLHYYPFPERAWTDPDLQALTETCQQAMQVDQLAVGILDSLPDFLASADIDENSGKDVTRFIRRLLHVFRQHDAALLVLDHLVKPDADTDSNRKKRSRYARGSGAKLAKAHLTILLETITDFDQHTSGAIRLWKTKDRRGRVDLPFIKKEPLTLAVNVADGHLQIEQSTAPTTPELEPWNGPSRCMDSCLNWLQAHPGQPFTTNQILDATIDFTTRKGFRKTTISDALKHLTADPTSGIHVTAGARNSLLYTYNPTLQTSVEDDENDF